MSPDNTIGKNKPEGIIFDLGDTICRTVSFDPVSGNKRVLEFVKDGTSITTDIIQQTAHEIYKEIEYIKETSMVEFSWQNFDRLLFETLSVSFNISYAELEREFWHAAYKFTPVNGIFDLLDTLEKNNIKTGILSNGVFTETTLEEELAKHDLAHRFSFIITSAEYGFRKPHRRIYQAAVRKMGLEPKDIWFIGDKLEYDIKGAINYGLYPVWYNSRNEPGNSDYEYLEIKSLSELKEIIESLY